MEKLFASLAEESPSDYNGYRLHAVRLPRTCRVRFDKHNGFLASRTRAPSAARVAVSFFVEDTDFTNRARNDSSRLEEDRRVAI